MVICPDTVIVAVLTIAVNAVVNIKIKFAPDAQTAARDLKGVALRVFQWILNGGLVLVLMREVFSSEPVTRLAVFGIALQVGVLTLIVLLDVFSRLLSGLEQIVGSQSRRVGITMGIKDVPRSGKKSAD